MPTPDDQYPPEIIVLLSSRIVSPASESVSSVLHPAFCDRIIPVEHIPIEKDSDANETTIPSHVQSWNENCGWSKLRLFELDRYDKILYIDADCLVIQDVSHLLRVDEPANLCTEDGLGNGEKTTGLLAAAPDIFPPDKFNAGVMVLRPSKAVFNDMMSRLPVSSLHGSAVATVCNSSYDGGDTGFLNSFYPGWYSEMPSHARLPFGYNAQRFMHHCTYKKRKNYWDDAIADLCIIHFSSSPKPWEQKTGKPDSKAQGRQPYLDEKDANSLQTVVEHGKLESMWQLAYERSRKYYAEQKAKGSKISTGSRTSQQEARPQASPRSAALPGQAAPQSTHRLLQKRFKELRKTMSTKEAMRAARAEYGLDQMDGSMNPGQAVGQMFGLM